MEVSIQTSGLHLAHGNARRLRRYIQQCIEGRVSWFTQRITHVAVRVKRRPGTASFRKTARTGD